MALPRGVYSHLNHIISMEQVESKVEKRKKKNPLVTIRREEIRLQSTQIQGNLPDPMCPVHNAQDPLGATRLDQPLKREPHARQTDNRIKHRNTNRQPLRRSTRHDLQELPHQLVMANGELVLDLAQLQRRGLSQRDKGLLDSAVHGVEIHQHIALLEDKVAQDGVDARRGVLDEHALVGGHIEQRGHGAAGFVYQLGLDVPDERIRTGLHLRLEVSQSCLHCNGICAKRAWGKGRC